MWITAISGEHLARAVAAAGGDVAAVRRELGLADTPAFEDRIAVETLVACWERALAGRRDLPVLAATRSNHDEHSLVGFCAANQPTIGDALGVLDRYFGAVSDAYAWRTVDDGPHTRLRADPLGPIEHVGWQAYLEFESLELAGIARRLTRGRAAPVAVSYVHAAPASADAMATAFGVAPVWGAESCEIVYPRAVRDLPLEGARAQLAALVATRLDVLVASTSVTARARGRVGELIRRGEATVDRLARTLAMSRRSLERSLAAEGTSAMALFDDARRRLALAWLPHASVDEVATRLGYSDARAFARAFRRWTGRSPKRGPTRARR